MLGAQDQAPGRGTLSTTTFQLLQGRRTVNLTYTFAEDIVLRLSDDAGSTPAVTGALRVVPGDPAVRLAGGEPHWVRPGRTVDLTARVTDTWGNGDPAAERDLRRGGRRHRLAGARAGQGRLGGHRRERHRRRRSTWRRTSRRSSP